jgi:glycine dehydrogenase subunit 1
MMKLSEIPGVEVPKFKSTHFKEFAVDFSESNKSVSDINRSLLQFNIQGGKPLNKEFPDLGESALFCVTEIHTQEDIDRLSQVLEEVLK